MCVVGVVLSVSRVCVVEEGLVVWLLWVMGVVDPNLGCIVSGCTGRVDVGWVAWSSKVAPGFSPRRLGVGSLRVSV